MKARKSYKKGGRTERAVARANRQNDRRLKRAERKSAFPMTDKATQKAEDKANRQNDRRLKKAVRRNAFK